MRPITKRFLLLGGFSGFAVVGFFFKARFLSRLLEQSTSDEVLFHADTTEKVIALTIDDSPHPSLTEEILDTLAEYDVPSTFFIIGGQVAGNESLLERMVREGHELGNHLMSDQRSIMLERAEFSRQLAAAHAIVSPFGPVRWFRPGSGWYNKRILDEIRPYGYRCALGSVYPYDAQFQSVEFASTYILSNVQPGSIIILHDGREERQTTVDILHRILPALKNRGYRFVTLSDLAEAADSPSITR
jgi:peptidoglycan/xylan/chitin deacetylase (PgdA/CDA1 family)